MLRQGGIVLALVSDPQGQNAKARPLVVISPTQEIASGNSLVAVAITSQFASPLAPDEVALPYHPGGQAATGLRKPCVAKCSWLAIIRLQEVLDIKGFVSNERLIAILTAVNQLKKE
jgi:mRNA-degrading endonuclease toxin of MazEF toxin-antitoxin module